MASIPHNRVYRCHDLRFWAMSRRRAHNPFAAREIESFILGLMAGSFLGYLAAATVHWLWK